MEEEEIPENGGLSEPEEWNSEGWSDLVGVLLRRGILSWQWQASGAERRGEKRKFLNQNRYKLY